MVIWSGFVNGTHYLNMTNKIINTKDFHNSDDNLYKTSYAPSPFGIGNSYDPEIYEQLAAHYNSGGRIYLYEVKRGDKDALIDNIPALETLNDVCEKVWDLFMSIANKEGFAYTFGCFDENPYRPRHAYYDGSSIQIARKEFIQCVKNQDIEHFLSFIVHNRAYHWNTVIFSKRNLFE